MTAKVTVLMSVYNGIPHLQEAVDSILSQSFTNFEFMIIDDCSTDGSRELIEELSKKDNRIRVIVNSSRKGLGSNLKKGVKLAKTQWIARMDADDISMPDRLEKQYNFATENPDVDIIGSWAMDINENGTDIGLRKVPVMDEQIIKYIWSCPIIHPTAFMRRESLLMAGSYGDEKRRQDYALWFRCAKAGLGFANIPEPLLKYRFSDEYFRKNNLNALIDQVKIGWNGCRLVKASPIAYVGVAVPLIKGILPMKCGMAISAVLKKFDPRNNA